MIEMLDHFKLDEYGVLSEKILENITQLEKAGATIGVISSNTLHIIFNKVEIGFSIQLISILTNTVEEAKNKGYKKVLWNYLYN